MYYRSLIISGPSAASKELAEHIQRALNRDGNSARHEQFAVARQISAKDCELVVFAAHHPLELEELYNAAPPPQANPRQLRIAVCKTWTVEPHLETLNDQVVEFVRQGAPLTKLESLFNVEQQRAQLVGERSLLSRFDLLLCFSEGEQKILRSELGETVTRVLTLPTLVATHSIEATAGDFAAKYGRSAGLVLCAAPQNLGLCILSALAVRPQALPMTFLCLDGVDATQLKILLSPLFKEAAVAPLFLSAPEPKDIHESLLSSHSFIVPGEYLIPFGGFPEQMTTQALSLGHNALPHEGRGLSELFGHSIQLLDFSSRASVRGSLTAAFFAPASAAAREGLLPYTAERFSDTLARLAAQACRRHQICGPQPEPQPHSSPASQPATNAEPRTLQELFEMVNAELDRKQHQRAYELLARLEGDPATLPYLKQAQVTVAMNEQNWPKALAFIGEAVALNSSDPKLHWLEANCRAELRDVIGVHQALIRTLALDPNHRRALLMILQTGAILNRRQDYEWYLRNYLKNNPTDIELACQLNSDGSLRAS